MKRPTWATIVGVLAIIFGLSSITGGAQEMALPSMLEFQKEMMANFGQISNEEIASQSIPGSEQNEGKQTADFSLAIEGMQEMLVIPEWFKTWAIIFGLVSMVVGAIYLLSGIFLLMTKPFAITVFYLAIGISILWAIVQAIVYSQSSNMMLMAQTPASIASIVIDIILVVVVLVGSKEAFVAQVEP